MMLESRGCEDGRWDRMGMKVGREARGVFLCSRRVLVCSVRSCRVVSLSYLSPRSFVTRPSLPPSNLLPFHLFVSLPPVCLHPSRPSVSPSSLRLRSSCRPASAPLVLSPQFFPCRFVCFHFVSRCIHFLSFRFVSTLFSANSTLTCSLFQMAGTESIERLSAGDGVWSETASRARETEDTAGIDDLETGK